MKGGRGRRWNGGHALEREGEANEVGGEGGEVDKIDRFFV